MYDKELLEELLASENEEATLEALAQRGLLADNNRWRYLGNMPNNQAIVHAQQSTPAAALVEIRSRMGVHRFLLFPLQSEPIMALPRGS